MLKQICKVQSNMLEYCYIQRFANTVHCWSLQLDKATADAAEFKAGFDKMLVDNSEQKAQVGALSQAAHPTSLCCRPGRGGSRQGAQMYVFVLVYPSSCWLLHISLYMALVLQRLCRAYTCMYLNRPAC